MFRKKTLTFMSFLLIITLVLNGCVSGNLREEGTVITAPSDALITTQKQLNIIVSSSVAEEIAPLFNLYSSSENVNVTTSVMSETEIYSALGRGEGTLIVSDSGYAIDKAGSDGTILDMKSSGSSLVSSVADKVPEYLKNTETVYYLPSGIDGYANLASGALLKDILSVSNEDEELLADNLRQVTAGQWETAVVLLEELISGELDAGEKISLLHTDYILPETLPETVENLVALHAFSLEDEHTFTSPLSIAHDISVDFSTGDLSEVYLAFVDYLDAKTAVITTEDTVTTRSLGVEDGLTDAVAAALFSQEKVLFWSSSLSKAHRILPPEIAEETLIFPFKMNYSDYLFEESSLPYVKNSEIMATTPFGFGISAQASPEEKEAALDFLVWFYYSTSGQSYIKDTLGLVDLVSMSATSPLATELLHYIENDYVMNDSSLYIDTSQWAGVKDYFVAEYLIDATWTDAEKTDFAEHIVSILHPTIEAETEQE